ncbi:DUF4350 domain-containing protein [Clostridium sp. YIM B02515]|uniref:DUF4350 domain-containing protein n=1 Tax=Clostridium rhizosphaerae TaxID=2803861 RepID=A0ABS1TB22_9CLOT|nr:DUF4350 domain-containing protein [Clostridium rhizosphaerae]MBL4936553.1 DUF4350 domain-containing protein [Clostridium rhizosphaerae]
MKVKKYRELIIFIILIPVFLLAAFFVSSRMENQLPAYSVINKSSLGSSVFYEAMKKLNMPVERVLKPVEEQDYSTIQIVVPGGKFDINSPSIKSWVNKGGVLVRLAAGNIHMVDYGVNPDIRGNITVYNYGKGAVITSDAAYITNKALLENTSNAYSLLSEVSNFNNRKIYFNETNLFQAAVKVSLWDFIPLWGRFLIFQFVLCLAAFFYYKGKRFGRPIALYEEVERSENEYLFSASALYRQAKSYDLIAESYYKNLLYQIRHTHENWLEYWEREELPALNKAKQAYEFMNTSKVKRKPKEYIQIITTIEQLNRILKKRRDSYWKALKKI